MRRPVYRRKNPKRLAVSPPPAGVDLVDVSRRATYVGDVRHKDTASFAGRVPHPTPDRSVCPRNLAWQQQTVQEWLRSAIVAGNTGDIWEGGFPKYIWHRVADTVFEGELMSPYGRGEYKGYPLEEYQQVRGLQ
jgi:hypothetical protein